MSSNQGQQVNLGATQFDMQLAESVAKSNNLYDQIMGQSGVPGANVAFMPQPMMTPIIAPNLVGVAYGKPQASVSPGVGMMFDIPLLPMAPPDGMCSPPTDIMKSPPQRSMQPFVPMSLPPQMGTLQIGGGSMPAKQPAGTQGIPSPQVGSPATSSPVAVPPSVLPGTVLHNANGWQANAKPAATHADSPQGSNKPTGKATPNLTINPDQGTPQRPVMPLTPASLERQRKMREIQKTFTLKRQTLLESRGESEEGAESGSTTPQGKAPSAPAAAAAAADKEADAAQPEGQKDNGKHTALKASITILTFGSLNEKVSPDVEHVESFEVMNTSSSDSLVVDACIPPVVEMGGETTMTIEPVTFSLAPGQTQKMHATFMTSCTTTVMSEVIFTCTLTDAEAEAEARRRSGQIAVSCRVEEVKLPIKVESALCSSLNFSEFAFTGRTPDSSLIEPRVLKATWRGQDCLVTIVERGKDHPGSTWSRYIHETTMLEKLRSPYILYCFGAVRSPKQFCMVTENIVSDTLMEDVKKAPLTALQTVRFALDIGRAMCFLHAAGVAHKNLTPHNILVISRDVHSPVCCKLMNFGLSRDIGHIDEGEFGPDIYMAPEVLKRRGYYKTSVDVFSYGVVLWVIAAREEPFSGVDFDKEFRGIIAQGKRLEIPSKCLPDLAAMIQLCWEQNPSDRPDFNQILFILEPLFWQLKTVQDAAVTAKQSFSKGFFGRKKKDKQ